MSEKEVSETALGRVLRMARAKKGIRSQAELGRKADLSRCYISQLEADTSVGNRRISDLQRICVELDLDLSDLTNPNPEPTEGAA